MAFMPVRAAVNQIDFLKILQRVSQEEPGKSFLEKNGPPVPAFADQEDIILKTIELTAADLAGRGESVSPKEIEDYARSISCRYDHEIHTICKGAVFTAVAHMFENDDLDRIFVSEDRRELKHIETLRQARKQGLGVVYLVNHSTHFDEFIVDVVLEQQGVQLPLFAAGSNMMATPSVEKILMMGSYLIIRKGATKTYLSTLFQYCPGPGRIGQTAGHLPRSLGRRGSHQRRQPALSSPSGLPPGSPGL